MPRPPPPAEALIAIGQPYSSPELDHRRGVADLLGRARHDRHARRRHALPRADLGAHRLDRRGRRADPDEPGLLAGAGEAGVLGQEPVARVDRLGPARPRRRDDPLDVQVALGGRAGPDQPRLVGAPHVQRPAIGLGVDRDRPDPELAQSAEDTDGDLAAVRDEHLAKRHGHGRGSLVRRGAAPGAGLADALDDALELVPREGAHRRRAEVALRRQPEQRCRLRSRRRRPRRWPRCRTGRSSSRSP